MISILVFIVMFMPGGIVVGLIWAAYTYLKNRKIEGTNKE